MGFVLDILALGQGRPKYWERNMYRIMAICVGYTGTGTGQTKVLEEEHVPYRGHFAHHKFHISCPETEPGPTR